VTSSGAARAGRCRSGSPRGTYDDVGNLASFTYPNGVQHSYTYSALNRLTTLLVQSAAEGPQSSYAYTLGPAGNRTGVTELSGRTVSYGYDNLYRLTSETIAGGAAQNGTISYTYDPVGNRQSLTSTVPAIPSGLLNYDANDRLAPDVYDANGNTTSSGGIGNSYDFENHLIQHGAVTIVYDGDGNRVAKTAGGVTTRYLVSELNPTGYVQVMDELQSGTVVRSYTYGLDLISERFSGGQRAFYSYDGHGSVRQLTNAAGNVTDTYTYDAFGNLIEQTGTTPNLYLYAGEQFDPDLGLYYNRARYLDVRSGRFWGMDTFEGNTAFPATLHAFMYAQADPTNNVDPSGRETLATTLGGTLPGLNTLAQATAISLVAACSAQLALAEGLDEAGVDVSGAEGVCVPKRRYEKITLYHYTDFSSVAMILKSNVLWPSLDPVHARFGFGQYFTDITPAEAASVTKGQFSVALYGGPWYLPGPVGYIGIRLSVRAVRRVSPVYGPNFPGRSFFLRESTRNLGLKGKVVDSGLVAFGQ